MRVIHIRVKTLIGLISVTLLTAAVAGGLFIYTGVYNVAAVEQHTQPVYDLLEIARNRSIAVRTTSIKAPALTGQDYQVRGVQLYQQYCVQCHGAPGVAPNRFSLGMMPAPSAIVKVGLVRSPEEIFWVIRNGIKMSGMPGWAFRLNQTEHWQLVALIKQMPFMTSADYKQLRTSAMTDAAIASNPASQHEATVSVADNQIQRGKLALIQYNCATCHNIPGITASDTYVGPPLHNIVKQKFVAGVLTNTDINLVEFIRFPQRHKKHTMMPNLGVNKADARAMVEYLRSKQ